MAQRTSQGVMDGGTALPSGTAQPALPLAEALGRRNPDQRAPSPALAKKEALYATRPKPPAQLIRATRSLCALLDPPATPSQGVNDDEIELLSVPVRLRRAGREIRMVINGTGSFAAKSDARLIKLLLRARRFNATLADSEGVPFATLAEREGVSRSYFTRLVRLSYLAPDITQAILDGRQPSDLTSEKLLEHSRLPLAWHDQRIVLGFA